MASYLKGIALLAWLLAGAVSAGEPPASAVYRGRTVSQWAGELGDKDFWVRWYATYALGRIGPDAVSAVPALERTLANLDEHEYVRGGAAWALGRIGPKAAPVVPLVIRTLASKHVSVRRNAAEALGRFAAVEQSLPSPLAGEGQGVRGRGVQGRKSSPAVAELLKRLDDQDAAVRVSAAVALWRIQRHPKAIPALESMLRDREGSTACLAATAIGELGADALPAVPALAAALAHPDADTRRAAAFSLGRIGPAAIPAIRSVLAAADSSTKCQAVEALGSIGPSAVAALIEAFGDPSPPVRRSAARAVGRLGPAARQAEPALVKAVSDHVPEVRSAAAEALKQIRGE
jgi:HEAT repeat protein